MKHTRAMLRIDIGLCSGIAVWLLLKSSYRIHVSQVTRNIDSGSTELYATHHPFTDSKAT